MKRTGLFVAAFICVLVGLAGSGAGAAEDDPLWTAPEIEGASSVVVVPLEDVDGDGVVDIFVFWTEASSGLFRYRVHRGGDSDGTGTVLEERTLIYGGRVVWRFAGLVGDVDGSGDQDVLVDTLSGFYTFGYELRVLRDFRTGGQLSETLPVAPGGPPYAWNHQLGRFPGLDFDGNGYDDFVTSQFLYLGGPEARLTYLDLAWGSDEVLYSVLMPDVDGDGNPDIVTVDDVGTPSHRLRVRSGNSAGHPGITLDLELPAGFRVHDLGRLDDFDGDGAADLVVIRRLEGQDSTDRTASIFRGGPALDAVPDLEINAGSQQVMVLDDVGDVGDLDGDGFGDLVLRSSSHGLFVYRGGPAADAFPDAWVTSSGIRARAVGAGDWDGDGTGDLLAYGRVWSSHIIDLNGDGIHDFDQPEVLEDCRGDQLPDLFEIALDPSLDCDRSDRIDDCELAEDPASDCDQNGVLDTCQFNATTDCDGNGALDSCELAADPSLDWDENGTIDTCQLTDPFFNCNGNGELDARELQMRWTWIDCDGNQRFDECEIADGSAADLDQNGRPDRCDGPLKISVSFDPSGSQQELEVGRLTPFDVYVVLESTGDLDPTRLYEVDFALDYDADVLALYGTTLQVPGSTDFELVDPLVFSIRFSPVAPDPAAGPVTLLRMEGLMLDEVDDVGIFVHGLSPLPGSPDLPSVPFWKDPLLRPTLMSSFHPAWLNRTFEDCNGNGVDDLVEIGYQWVEDFDGDLVPDPCDPTSAPAAAVRRFVEARPNPFNPRTTLRFGIEQAGRVRLEIFDLHGRRVRRILDQPLEAGRYARVWDGSDDAGRAVASGVYFYRLSGAGPALTGKLALVR